MVNNIAYAARLVIINVLNSLLYKLIGSDGRISRIWSTGNMVLWIAVVLSQF